MLYSTACKQYIVRKPTILGTFWTKEKIELLDRRRDVWAKSAPSNLARMLGILVPTYEYIAIRRVLLYSICNYFWM